MRKLITVAAWYIGSNHLPIVIECDELEKDFFQEIRIKAILSICKWVLDRGWRVL